MKNTDCRRRAEAATGVALILSRRLSGDCYSARNLQGSPIAWVTGIALIALGVGCLPGSTALSGMLTYSALITLFFLYLGIRGEWVGPLLWPAGVLHAVRRSCLPVRGAMLVKEVEVRN